jgi:hypothetical protein
MTFEYAFFFVENTASNSNANIASAALIRNDADNELILWSKKMKNKNEMNRAQEEFKQWWYFTSYEIKNVNLTIENKLLHMKWKEINRTSENWQHFIECARATDETSRLLCRRCEDDLIHFTSTREKINAIKNHRKKKNCLTRETNKYSHTNVINFMNKINIIFFLTTFFNERVFLFSRFFLTNMCFFLTTFFNEHECSFLSKVQKDLWIQFTTTKISSIS